MFSVYSVVKLKPETTDCTERHRDTLKDTERHRKKLKDTGRQRTKSLPYTVDKASATDLKSSSDSIEF